MSPQNTKTPAMVLQEWAVKCGCSPEYVLVRSKTGTHENEFYYQVNVSNISAHGFGRSKQVAKHDAATKALEILAEQGLYDPEKNPAQEFHAQAHRNESDSPHQPQVNFVGSLKDICCEYKLPYPEFIEISDVGPPHCRQFTYECKVGSITTQATANTKKQAKQLAARQMLEERVQNTFPEIGEHKAEANSLTEREQQAINKYKLLSNSFEIFPDRSVKVDDLDLGVLKIMHEKGTKKEDFFLQLQKRDKEGLDYICDALGVQYKIELIQVNPPIAVTCLGIDTPFTVLQTGKSKEDAEKKVIEHTFKVLETFMSEL